MQLRVNVKAKLRKQHHACQVGWSGFCVVCKFQGERFEFNLALGGLWGVGSGVEQEIVETYRCGGGGQTDQSCEKLD